MIQTVCGEMPKEKLGVTMDHEHLFIDLTRIRKDKISVLNDMNLVSNELLKAVNYGCKSVVEVTTADMGRNTAGLQDLSKKTGVNIICSTGFYMQQYHSEKLKVSSIDEIENFFEKEINDGIEETGIKAGIIGEVASSDKIYPSEEKVLTAAARASKKTNTAVITHCNLGHLGQEQIDLMLKQGMKPDKLILSHTDITADKDYLTSLLKNGINLSYDTIGKNSYLSDEIRVKVLLKLLEDGWDEHIMLSQDVSKQTYLTKFGGKGYTAVLGSFIPALRKNGVSEKQIDQMLVKNPARILDK